MENQIILASSSPRRKALLEEIGLLFDICPADVDEGIEGDESPHEHALRLAERKSQEASKRIQKGWIIGADTIVSIDNRILGKPADLQEARKMLTMLSGRRHKVITAFCILNASTGAVVKKAVESRVKIKRLTHEEIDNYLQSSEPFDKAGAYAVQGIGSFMVEQVEGSYTNVVGLPMEELTETLKELNILNHSTSGKRR